MGKQLTAHFNEDEFKCKCRRPDCDAPPMRPEFMAKLERLRVKWGKPMSPTSARRCQVHNKKVFGAPRSQHLLGNAADFFFRDRSERDAFIAVAEEFFNGIGIGEGLVHLDDRKTRARWDYGGK